MNRARAARNASCWAPRRNFNPRDPPFARVHRLLVEHELQSSFRKNTRTDGIPASLPLLFGVHLDDRLPLGKVTRSISQSIASRS